MKNLLSSICLIVLLSNPTEAQLFDSDVYNVNPWVDIPVTIAAFGMNTWGLAITDRKPILDSATIYSLDPNDINAFDRPATMQDASRMHHAWDMSDIGMRGSIALPLVLLIDREIRNDYLPVILLYFQAQGITGTIWSWGAAMHIDRIRPLVYNPDVPYGEKTFHRNKNSFFSGHTSTAAVGSFFTAKVFCDYHPELGAKKFLIYGLAVIPPAFTGYYRYKGMKHFPTDVIAGMAVGGATGILVPHLHKHRKNKNLTMIPITGPYTGFAMSLKF